MFHQAALQVGGFVGMPGIFLGELVNHTDDFGQELFCFGPIGDAAELCNRRTSRLLVEAVGYPLFGSLADAFFC